MRRATLIDNIFCNLSHSKKASLSGIIVSNLSDHLPYFICLDQKLNLQHPPKYIQVETKDSQSIQNFVQELSSINFTMVLDSETHADPNINYNKLQNVVIHAKNKHLPVKTVKFNKYKHKRSPWITNGILRSLKFRDNLYKSLKCTMIDTPLYYTRKHNLRVYNQILDRNIRSLKKEYYCRQFENFKMIPKRLGT